MIFFVNPAKFTLQFRYEIEFYRNMICINAKRKSDIRFNLRIRIDK